jgi:hypothetical protein
MTLTNLHKKGCYPPIGQLLLRAGQARTHRVLRDQRSPVWLVCRTRRTNPKNLGQCGTDSELSPKMF